MQPPPTYRGKTTSPPSQTGSTSGRARSRRRLDHRGLANLVVVLMLLAVLVDFHPASASAQRQSGQFAPGDVLVSLNTDGGAYVEWHGSDGTYYQTLDASVNKGSAAGLRFDNLSQKLYVTNWGGAAVSQFDMNGALVGTFGSHYSAQPESIAFDAKGDAYVGQADGDVLAINPSGNPFAAYRVALENKGSDWIDLASDQCTLFYTSEGKSIKRYNVCTDQQLDDFTANLAGDTAYALRLLPDGGLLVADWQVIYRLDNAGALMTAYTAPNEGSWYAVALDPDGKSFWGGGRYSGHIYKFDLDSGKVISDFFTNSENGVNGLEVIPALSVQPAPVTPAPAPPTIVPAAPTAAPIFTAPAPVFTAPPYNPVPTPEPNPSGGLIVLVLLLGGVLFVGAVGVGAIALIIRAARPKPAPAKPEPPRSLPVQVRVQSHAEMGEAVIVSASVTPHSKRNPPEVRLSFDPGQVDSSIEFHNPPH